MKIRTLSMSVTAIILTCCTFSSSAQTLTPDLRAVLDGKGWKGDMNKTNIEHPTSNAEHRSRGHATCSTFDVRCSMFSVRCLPFCL